MIWEGRTPSLEKLADRTLLEFYHGPSTSIDGRWVIRAWVRWHPRSYLITVGAGNVIDMHKQIVDHPDLGDLDCQIEVDYTAVEPWLITTRKGHSFGALAAGVVMEERRLKFWVTDLRTGDRVDLMEADAKDISAFAPDPANTFELGPDSYSIRGEDIQQSFADSGLSPDGTQMPLA